MLIALMRHLQQRLVSKNYLRCSFHIFTIFIIIFIIFVVVVVDDNAFLLVRF